MADSSGTQPTYSVSVRLQRTTTEECFVAVPVTSDVLKPQAHEDGEYSLDTEKLFAAVIELGQRSETWSVESQHVALHPIQMAPSAHRDDATPTE